MKKRTLAKAGLMRRFLDRAVEELCGFFAPSSALQPPAVRYFSRLLQLEERSLPSVTPLVPRLAMSTPPMQAQQSQSPAVASGLSEATKLDLVVIDTNVPNYQQLVQDIQQNQAPGHKTDFVYLGDSQNGVVQLSNILVGYSHLDSIQIISHGAPGEVELGNQFLQLTNFGTYAQDIQGWSTALNPGADILFYGCDLAANADGQQLLQEIHQLTGAGVAGNTNPTGAANLGGDWNLNYTVGPITTTVALTPQEQQGWDHLLSVFMVTTTADSGPGSLRQALLNSNATPGANTINFNIGGGSATISPISALPIITQPVTIDGTTQPGYSGIPHIVLDGSQAGASTPGLDITAGNSTVKGLVINNFSGSGIILETGGNNLVDGNYIGTDGSGTIARGNGSASVWDPGLLINNSANNTIGGATAGAGNLISGNVEDGLDIEGNSSNNNLVQGNYVGTTVSGNAALMNGIDGIWVGLGAHNNTIGGTATGDRNVVSGNWNSGIQVAGATTSGNLIQGNFVGTNAAGTAAVANQGDGFMANNSPNNTVGGCTPGAGNLIADNDYNGVLIFGTNATGNVVQGNTISGNVRAGVSITDIGDGLGSPIGGASNNIIGGAMPGEGNVIAFNHRQGISVVDSGSTGNSLRGNAIYGNTDLGIDLGANGVTNNHSGFAAGPNNYQNYPVLTLAVLSGTSLTITGTFSSTDSTTFTLDFYANTTGDPSGHGQGQYYLGATTVTTDASGNGSFSATLNGAGVSVGAAISATATDPGGNTSEFAPNIPVQSPPVAQNDTYSVTQGSQLNPNAQAGVLMNDTDPQGHPLTAILVSGPANGTLNFHNDGSFQYTPNTPFYGTDSFTYQAYDGPLLSNVATVTITVNAVPSPVAQNDSYSVNENTNLGVGGGQGVLANDADPQNRPLTAVLASGPSNGTLTLHPDGSFQYTPNTNFVGTDSFTYLANNQWADSNVATVTITVNHVYQPPTAVNDFYATSTVGTLSIGGPGVLANDTDPQGLPLTAVLVNGPSHGTLQFNSNGSFDYTPNLLFVGTDQFTYKASDGQGFSNNAMVTLTVAIVAPGSPVAQNDSYSVTQGDQLNPNPQSGVLANDTDPQGRSLTAVLVSGPRDGTLNLSGNGSFQYTPNASFHGTDSFTYQANDGQTQSNIATVTITVNAAPPVANNDSYSTNQDVSLSIAPGAGVLANDADPLGRNLTAVLVTGPAHGSFTFNPNGTFQYLPNPSFAGIDTFTYLANDGLNNSNIATGTIIVHGPPTVANQSYAAVENTPLTVATPGLLANVVDPQGMPLSAVLVSGPANGLVALDSNGSFTYTPNPNFYGTDSFSFEAYDGQYYSNVATVAIAVEIPPIAVNDNYTTLENQSLNVIVPGVLVNDSSSQGNPLTAQLVSNPTNGTVTLDSNGSFTYTPNANFIGTDSFSYQASDGLANSNTAVVSITVYSPPVAANDSYSTNVNTPLTVAAGGVLANDTDSQGLPLTAVLVTGPSDGALTLNANGSFSYTPNANYYGPDSFTYRANDGLANSNVATVSLTVNSLPPVANNAGYNTNVNTPLNVAAAGVLANDMDPQGLPLTAVLVSGPSNGTLTLNADGSFNYSPNANFVGSDSFTYQINDGLANSNVSTVSLTVTDSLAPVANNANYSTNVNTPLSVAAAGVLANDTDPWGLMLTAALVSGPSNGMVTLNPDGSFSYTPNANYFGSDSFTYQANDGLSSSNVATVFLTVNALLPVANNASYSTNVNTTLTVAASGVLGNDTDPQALPLSSILVSGPSDGTLTLNANGSFSYTPNTNYYGSDSFTYRANDGLANSNVATVFFTVNALPPVAANYSYSTNLNTPLNISASGTLANDTDPQGLPLSTILVSGPSNGTLTLNANGSFNYTPNANFYGVDNFTYQANDSLGNSNVATVTLTVNPLPPVAVNDGYIVNFNTPLNVASGGMLANDTDPQGLPLTATLVTGPANGTLTLNGNGSFSYTPAANFYGWDGFTYQVSDGLGNSNVAHVALWVNSPTPPVANPDSYATHVNTPLTVAAPGVLSNDFDPQGRWLVAFPVSDPSHGSLSLNLNGSFTYTPDTNYVGTDSFTYRAVDWLGISSLTTVSLSVNSLPPIAANDTYALNVNTSLHVAAAGVLSNDTDPQGLALRASLVSGPSHGVLTLNSTGSFSYTPTGNYVGTDSFTYRANDGLGNSNIATVSLTVNALAPVAINDTYTLNVNTSLHVAAAGVLANDTDPQGRALTAIQVSGPKNGTLTLYANGSFTYTPNANYLGLDSFSYRANDGLANSTVATVTLTVKALPPLANNDSYTTMVNAPLTVGGLGILANDTDPQARPLTAILVSGPVNGFLSLNANGSFTYTPKANYLGSDSFTYQVNDGLANSNVATATVRITGLIVTLTPSQGATSASGTDSFTVALGAQPTAKVVISLSSSALTTFSLETLTFNKGNWNVAQTVTVTNTTNLVPNAAQSYGIQLTALSADSGYKGLTSQLTLTNKTSTSETPVAQQAATPTVPQTIETTTLIVSTNKGAGASTSSAASTGSSSVVVSSAVDQNQSRAVFSPSKSGNTSSSSQAGPPSDSSSSLSASFSGQQSQPGQNESDFDGQTAVARRRATSPLGGSFGSENPGNDLEFSSGSRTATMHRGRGTSPVTPGLLISQGEDLTPQEDLALADEVRDIALTGVLAGAGYLLLNTRPGFWLLSLITAKPLWRDLDPLEILYAWDHEQGGADKGEKQKEKETLLSLVE